MTEKMLWKQFLWDYSYNWNRCEYSDNRILLYISIKPIDNISKNEALHHIECCLTESVVWMNCNMFEADILFSLKQNFKQVDSDSVKFDKSLCSNHTWDQFSLVWKLSR